jgi:hypothetical protein
MGGSVEEGGEEKRTERSNSKVRSIIIVVECIVLVLILEMEEKRGDRRNTVDRQN